MSHYTLEALAEYVEMQLADEDALVLEEHLADCARCADLARTAHLLTAAFDGWTAQAHGAAFLAAQLQRAVATVQRQAASAPWHDRLATWVERWAGTAEVAVRVVFEGAGQASRVVTEGLEPLTRPGTSWQFSLATAATPTRGLPGRGATPPRPTVAVAALGGAAQARVAVSGERRDVVIRLDALPATQAPPLVLLVPLAGDAEPRVTAPARQPGVEYLIARFDNVPIGSYLVAFEPVAQP